MRWLWSNWELKLVSLVVAAALWTYTSGQVRVERVMTVELRRDQIAGLGQNLSVAEVTPADFVAVLSVPTSKLDALRGDVLHPQLTLPRDRREPGAVAFPLTGRLLGLDSDIRILRTEPANLSEISVTLSAIAETTLVAEPPEIVGLPPSVAADVVLDRTRIEARGSREVVRQAEATGRPLRFEPVRIDGVDPAMNGPRQERVVLRVQPGHPEPILPVVAVITLRPAHTDTVVLRLPVSVLFSPADAGRWKVAGEPPMVELHCTGAETVVRTLRSDQIVAWVDLHAGSLTAGQMVLPVQALTPAGVTVAPATASLSLEPAAP